LDVKLGCSGALSLSLSLSLSFSDVSKANKWDSKSIIMTHTLIGPQPELVTSKRQIQCPPLLTHEREKLNIIKWDISMSSPGRLDYFVCLGLKRLHVDIIWYQCQ
jgi:hypothetical protein